MVVDQHRGSVVHLIGRHFYLWCQPIFIFVVAELGPVAAGILLGFDHFAWGCFDGFGTIAAIFQKISQRHLGGDFGGASDDSGGANAKTFIGLAAAANGYSAGGINAYWAGVPSRLFSLGAFLCYLAASRRLVVESIQLAENCGGIVFGIIGVLEPCYGGCSLACGYHHRRAYRVVRCVGWCGNGSTVALGHDIEGAADYSGHIIDCRRGADWL